jgi:predicted RNA-binding protein with PIN domain
MPILIDGHNLIGQLPMLSLEDPDDEQELISLLVSYRARTGKAIAVVFDPGGAFALARARRHGGIEVVFAPHGGSADGVIARRVGRSRNPQEWLVVTSDRKLTESVTRQGARVLRAEDFASELELPVEVEPDRRELPPPPDEVEAWLALFEDRD